MLVYRISKTAYAGDLKGIGSKLFGGRWNNKRTACIYTSASRALAVLEFAANVELEFCPTDLSITIYEIPEAEFAIINPADLPEEWNELPAPQSIKDLGTKYLKDLSILGLHVPSVIVPEEFNYLINAESDKINSIKVIKVTPFIFDTRIKR
jgi:RES domain-containing protein